ncbi:HAD family hydrolase [Oxalobacteraceae bacterium OTU3CINTB1]|nr:HAD family hydrolase [Oxalobacteraceae bacterium OTU3CINTB1]
MAVSAAGAAVFLDKDGTLIDDVPYNVDPGRMTLAPGAVAGLRRLSCLGYRLLVVSNQPGVAQGRFDAGALEPVRQRLAQLLSEQGVRLEGFYYCPHAPDDGCACRKPLPGMLLTAAAEHQVDLAASWMIGDILDDVEAGARAGCRTILVDNGNETLWLRSPLRTPTWIASDLDAAAQLIQATQGMSCLASL